MKGIDKMVAITEDEKKEVKESSVSVEEMIKAIYEFLLGEKEEETEEEAVEEKEEVVEEKEEEKEEE